MRTLLLLLSLSAGCGDDKGVEADGGSAARDAGTRGAATQDAGPPPFVEQARTELADGTIVLRTNVPARVSGCDAAPGAPCEDRDADGLVDRWEGLVLERLRPLVQLDEAEPLLDDAEAVTAMVGRVAPAETGEGIRAFIMIGYSRDYGSCGLSAHDGDSERVALSLELLGAADVRVASAYTAAHEGTLADHGRVFTGADLSMLEYVDDPVGGEPRWRVQSSERKHATYASVALCEGASMVPCFAEDCGPEGVDDPSRYELLMDVANAGEPDAPMLTDLGPIGFPGDDAWADRDFCGGRGGSNCSSPVREKLLVDPF